MILPDDAKRIIDILAQSSYSAYAVGGCVRDAIMGRKVSDYDITTSAPPMQVEEVLEQNGIKYVETGLKHGTITAVIDHKPYEITTFRTDGKYSDNRHPESVSFVTDVKDDLSRRDFTINAIAYNDNEGYVDLFGGREDIDKRIIRTVGDADKRFQEDALRIMRALRFSSQLGFSIEENTEKAIFANKHLLENIANERIYSELIKILIGDNCEDVLLKYREVIAVVIPELRPSFDFPQHNKWHLYDVYTHSVKSVALIPKKDYMRLAMLLHDIGKPQCKTTDEDGCDHFYSHAQIGAEKAETILKRLRVSNDIRNNAVTLIENHSNYLSHKTSTIKRRMRVLGEELIFDFIDFQIADLKSHNPKYANKEIRALEEIRQITNEIINSKEAFSIKELDINGYDLMALGFEGKEISEVLEKLLEEVIANPEKNKKEILIRVTKRLITRKNPRLAGYDYSSNGIYFITICTNDMKCILSKINECNNISHSAQEQVNNVGAIHESPEEVSLSEYGLIVKKHISSLPKRFGISIPKYVIMPNHIHLLIVIDNRAIRESPLHSTRSTISNIIGYLKMNASKEIHRIDANINVWQRGFYDHIIRDEEDYLNHLQYIDENPKKWLLGKDEYYL